MRTISVVDGRRTPTNSEHKQVVLTKKKPVRPSTAEPILFNMLTLEIKNLNINVSKNNNSYSPCETRPLHLLKFICIRFQPFEHLELRKVLYEPATVYKLHSRIFSDRRILTRNLRALRDNDIGSNYS